MTNQIFYFTGTGNSKQIAKDLAKKLGDCKVTAMGDWDLGEKVRAERVGFVFPIYFFGLPKFVKTFLKEVRVDDTMYFYAVCNFGGSSGVGLNQANDIMKKRMLTLHAGYSIAMPGNYLVAYNTFKEEKQRKLFEKEAEITTRIAAEVKQKKSNSLEQKHKVWDFLLGQRVSKRVDTFYNEDRFFTVNENCNGCGRCAKNCPVHNIVITDNKPKFSHTCEFCLGCLQTCPTEAIDYKNKTKGKVRYQNPNV